ncbi:hypothetical protein L6R46_10495 [Myxococcota bacterium]|jgi:hypothetical protein|nr:hypothetical protein [Myxococcota bacterium]
MTTPLNPAVQGSLNQLARLYGMLEDNRRTNAGAWFQQASEEGIVAEIHNVQRALAEQAQIPSHKTSDVQMRLIPKATQARGFHSAHLLLPIVEGWRLAIQTLVSYKRLGLLPRRPDTETLAGCDVGVDWVGSGSIQVGLTLPRPVGPLGRPIEEATELLLLALRGLDEASGDPDDALAQVIPDDELRVVVLTQLSRFAPGRQSGLAEVQLSGAMLGTSRRLTTATSGWIQRTLTRLNIAPRQELRGIVRGLNLDRGQLFIKTADGTRVTLEVSAARLEELKPQVMEQVVVTARPRMRGGRPTRALVLEQLHREG